MPINEYIAALPAERQQVITALHQVIVDHDPSVIATIKPMMRQEMILYEQAETMKYGLASGKAHLSFHCLPMYMNSALHNKYQELLPSAKFQKGCIKFTDLNELPLNLFNELITECAAVNIAQVLADRKKKK